MVTCPGFALPFAHLRWDWLHPLVTPNGLAAMLTNEEGIKGERQIKEVSVLLCVYRQDWEKVQVTRVAVNTPDSAVSLQRLRQNPTDQVIDFWKCHIEARWIHRGQTQINIGQDSAFINLGNTPLFVTYFSFNLLMLIHCIDFGFVCIWGESRAAWCSFPDACVLSGTALCTGPWKGISGDGGEFSYWPLSPL